MHEYGIAIGAGKPHARVFDVTHQDLPKWRQIVSPRGGELAGSYNTNLGLDTVRNEIEKVFSSLTNRIEESRHGRLR
jgi:hypothetical protein